MMFFDSFLGADVMSVSYSPVIPAEINKIKLDKAWVDKFWATKNITFPIDFTFNNEWNWDMIMYAEFINNTYAGNVEWSLDTVSHLAVKRRPVGGSKWITIAVKPIHDYEDFNVVGTDQLTESIEYEYQLVPYFNEIAGNATSVTIKSHNEYLVIFDKDGLWYTELTDGFCNTQDVAPSQAVETLHNRYPTIISNGKAQYETVTVDACFLPLDENGCIPEEIWEDDNARVLYQRRFKDWLTDRHTKILRNVDGQTWLCFVTTPPTDSADSDYNNRKFSFGVTEVGHMQDVQALYDSGMYNIEKEWWSK